MTVKAREIDVEALVDNIEDLLDTRIFSAAEAGGPLFKSAYAWLILNLDALLAEADRRGQRINVDMVGAEGAVDITDLIARARYAIVHAIGGDKYRVRANAAKSEIQVGDASGFVDDIAVINGAVRVLIRRHAVTAFEEARAVLKTPT